ncbi:MAG: MerC domain-containing protein [Maricaulaceae bacterium]
MSTLTYDRAGIALSTLCIAHCILLPVLSSVLPMVGIWAENEMIHKALVLLAVIPAAFAFSKMIVKFAPLIRGLAVIGITLLAVGAFIEPLHDFETPLTIAGALCLAAAHGLRSFVNRPHSRKA